MSYKISISSSRQICIFCLLLILIVACTHSTAPVSSRGDSKPLPTTEPPPVSSKLPEKKSDYHIVARGDTLYSIAWNYSLDYRDVAVWNNIQDPYLIYPEQLIRLAPSKPFLANKFQQPTKKTTVDSLPTEEVTVGIEKRKLEDTIYWHWPVNGRLIESNTPIAKKGLDIAGKKGQIIVAAAKGDVVYSGSGLLGYGRLIIIKHSDAYLSAYAYNDILTVKEGDSVIAGQEIARMGQVANGQAMLHFEIRKNGTPVDPFVYLPKSRS